MYLYARTRRSNPRTKMSILAAMVLWVLWPLSRQEVMLGRNSRGLRIRASFLAGGREGEPAWKLVLILKHLLFLLGNTCCLP